MITTTESKRVLSMKRPRYMSEAEFAQKIYEEFTRARLFDQKNAERCFQNNRLYWSVDTDRGLGQIAPAVVAEMVRIGKMPGAYNICKPVVDNVVGGFLQAPLTWDLRPLVGKVNSLTYATKEMMFAEAEEMDWSVSEGEALINGCIYRADMQMYLDRTDSKRTLIGWRVLPEGEVTYPPKLSSRHKERRKLWRKRMMTAADMLEFFSWNRNKIIQAAMFKEFGEDALKEWAKLHEQYGEEYGPNSGIVPFSTNDKMWGTEYEVILFYHMEKVTRKFEYVLTEDGEKVELPADLTDPAAKIEWMNANVPGWVPDAVFADEEDLDIQYMTAVCPSLANNMLLCDGPTDEQCGMLTIAPWSAYFKNGEFGGLIDAIKDLQLSLNWIQNTLQYRLHVDGEGTSWYVYPEAFLTMEEYERWVDCKNKAGEAFKMKPGMEARFPNGPAIPVQKSPYPREAMDRLEHLLDKMLPLIGKYTPASRGQSESSSESGYMFNLKKLQNDVERKILFESRRQFKNLQGEMYLGQVIRLRGDRFEREFNALDGTAFKINERVTETTSDGEVIEFIANDISKLKEIRHKIIIVETPDSPTLRAEQAQIANEKLAAIKSPNAVPVSYVMLTHDLLDSDESKSDEDQRMLDEIRKKEIELAMSTADAQIATNKANAFKALQSMQPVAPSIPGMPGAGTPAGGGGGEPGFPGEGAPVGTMQQEMAMA
jgi:hypothetical protein